MVPAATFTSYYGKPVISSPVWKAPNIAGCLFLGGLAGASSLVGAGAQLTGRHILERVAKTGALAASGMSVAALVTDRPASAVRQHAADMPGDVAYERGFLAARRLRLPQRRPRALPR